MMNQIRKNLRDFWAQAYISTITLFPRLSGAEITRLTWAELIETYDEIPATYRNFFDLFQKDKRTFPYVVLTPSYEGFIQPTTEKLVCDCGSEIWVLEKREDTYDPVCYPVSGIHYLEVRTALLYSHIKISGITEQGELKTTTFRFNSVTDYLFKPILKKIRLANAAIEKSEQVSQADKFDNWIRLNFKFMSFARRSLLGGEKVIQAVLLPEIRESRLNLLGKAIFSRTIVPAQACILTDRELILIREEASKNQDGKYGGTWFYFPVAKIAALSLNKNEHSLFELTVDLKDSVHLAFQIPTSARDEISQLIECYSAHSV